MKFGQRILKSLCKKHLDELQKTNIFEKQMLGSLGLSLGKAALESSDTD